MRFKQPCCLIFAITTLAASQALAQPYPNKPIRVIVAIATGSPTDVVMRAVGNELLKPLGQPLLIDNRPGGNNMIAMEACAKAAADGYTFCVVPNAAMSLAPHIVSKMPYDPERDFKPVTGLWYLIQGMMATASLPASTARELQVLATSRPGSLNAGTVGTGGADLHRQWLNEQWKANIVGVPYKGANLVMNALIAGEVQLSLIALGSMGGQLKAGKIKLLAVASSKRLWQFPDVATYAETGLEGVPRTWWGLLAPAGTQDTMTRRLNSELVRLFHEPKFKEYLENQFLESMVALPEEFAVFLKADREATGLLVKRFNIPRQ